MAKVFREYNTMGAWRKEQLQFERWLKAGLLLAPGLCVTDSKTCKQQVFSMFYFAFFFFSNRQQKQTALIPFIPQIRKSVSNQGSFSIYGWEMNDSLRKRINQVWSDTACKFCKDIWKCKWNIYSCVYFNGVICDKRLYKTIPTGIDRKASCINGWS